MKSLDDISMMTPVYNMKSTSLTARAFILYTGVIILMSSRLFYPVSRLPLLLSA